MAQGRRSKPGALHDLAGNPGKRKRPRELELERHSGRVPRELEDAATRLVWERAIKPLCDLGAVKKAQQSAAILACQAIADALEIEDRRRERVRIAAGLLGQLRSVAHALAECGAERIPEEVAEASAGAFRAVERMARAWAKMERPTALRAEARQWLSEFGLTPSSAAKLVAGNRAPGAEDPLGTWLEEQSA